MLGPLLDDLIATLGRKHARRCGENHIWKSNVSKTEGFEPLLLFQMSFCWQIEYSQNLTWWGWGFRFCRHISGKHQKGPYKTKNIAFEQANFRPTKSKHPTPLLLGHRAPGAPTKSKSFESTCYIQALKFGSNTPSKTIPETNWFCRGNRVWGLKIIKIHSWIL